MILLVTYQIQRRQLLSASLTERLGHRSNPGNLTSSALTTPLRHLTAASLNYAPIRHLRRRSLSGEMVRENETIAGVFAVSAITLHPDWAQLAYGPIPKLSQPDSKHTLLYRYFAVSIFR